MSYDFVKSTKETLQRQKNGGKGNYRTYLVNLYNLFYEEAKLNGTDWCPSVSVHRMVQAAYFGLEVDHMSRTMVLRWKDDLKKLGYICDKNVNGEWRTYILKELDF